MHSQILLKSTSRPGREATRGEGAASVSFGGPLHRNSVLLRAGKSGHDLGSCEGERAIDSAIRRFKKQCEKADLLHELCKPEHYDEPSVRRKKKAIAARKRALRCNTRKPVA